MSSLPYRQLRNRRGAVKPLRTRSLPYRQLRKLYSANEVDVDGSLPYRLLRNSYLTNCCSSAGSLSNRQIKCEKSSYFRTRFSLNMTVRGGIDSLRSPCGQPTHCVRGLSNWLRQLSNRSGLLIPPGVQYAKKKLALSYELFFEYGGEGGIRTPDTLPYTHFPGVLLQPLGHLTKLFCCQTSWVATGRYYRELE